MARPHPSYSSQVHARFFLLFFRGSIPLRNFQGSRGTSVCIFCSVESRNETYLVYYTCPVVMSDVTFVYIQALDADFK